MTQESESEGAEPTLEPAIDALGAVMRERAEEVAALMNVIPVAIYLAHDRDCTAVTTNAAAHALLAPPSAIAAHPYPHRVYQDGRELTPHEMPIQRAAAQGVATDGEEYEIRFADGTSRYIYGYARPLYDAAGGTRGSVAAFVDVTERRQSENALRESEARFRALADNVPAMIWVADGSGAVTYCNRTWRDYTGRSFEAGAAIDWLDCVHPDDSARVEQEFQSHIEDRRPFALQLRLRAADGSYRWMLNNATPLYDADGAFSGYIGTCADITSAKLHEARLEEAGRQKDEFLATLAHELRNPLAPIRSALQILGSGAADVSSMRWAREVIERQLGQLGRLVDDLLDVARAACGQLELKRETMTVDRLVHDAVEASRPLLERASHDLHVTLPAEPVLVHGDPVRLAEILTNLLNNAAKYTPEGGEVWVSCERAGERALIKVRDSGIGIAADALPGIFTMFGQVADSLDRAQGGLGVGLALARRLAELHEGELVAHSDGPGRGSEFVLTLPLAQVPAPQSSTTPHLAPPAGRTGLRVLVVDDSEDAAESLAMLLRLNGHTVDTAGEGLAALERFRLFSPDAVVLDIGLPGMSGYEVAEHIRRLPGGPDVRLIALTGWGREEERSRAFAAGFDHHLTKPVGIEQLHELLAAVPQA